MNKSIIIFLIIFSIGNCFAQENIFSKKLTLKSAGRAINELDILHDKKTNSYCNIIYSGSELEAVLLDSNYSEVSTMISERMKILFPKYLGTTLTNQTYYSYSVDGSENEIFVNTFNFTTLDKESYKFTIPIHRKENIIASYSHNASLFLFTVRQNTSDLKIYEYKEAILENEIVLELNNKDFFHFLGDNLYNCINHDKIRPFSTNSINDFMFSDKEDYMVTDDEKVYIVSNTNTVIEIDILTKKYNVRAFESEFGVKKKKIFKNVIKDTHIRSAIADGKFFRHTMIPNNTIIEVFDLETKERLKSINIYHDILLKSSIFSDRKTQEQLKNSITYEAYRKGKKAFRVYETNTHYLLNFGKDIDRIFELYFGYFEIAINKNTLEIEELPEQNAFIKLREQKQNLNFEYIEHLFRNHKNELYLLQLDKKQKTLKLYR
ncbi:MAG: hypothetical protein ACPGSD_03735 [Flavobacteriales bacterium]